MSGTLDWDLFCRSFAPGLLDEWGAPEVAARLAQDLIARASSFAESGPAARAVLRAPFLEEVTGYEPVGAPAELLATVCVIVRCSVLEEAHVAGVLHDDGIEGLTSTATAPLFDWLGDHAVDAPNDPAGVFAGLNVRWPRAWAALGALARSAGGGRAAFRMPVAPVPERPDDSERYDARTDAEGRFVVSAMDARFDQGAMRLLEAAGPQVVLVVSSLSRLSRHLDKMLRMLEIILSRGGSLLTTNSLIRPGEVFSRSGELLRSDSWDLSTALEHTQGLSGIHRKTLMSVVARLA